MKIFLNKTLRGVFTSLLLLILSGCEDNFFNADSQFNIDNRINADNLDVHFGDFFDDYLLYATFEGDAIPGAPNKALPGLPIGDKLMYETDNTTFVLFSDGQKSIYIPEDEDQYSSVNSDTRMQFVSRSGSSNGVVTVTWAGQLVGHQHHDNNETDEYKQDGSKNIWITDGEGNPMASFEIACLSIRSVDLLYGFPCGLCTQYNWSYYHLFPNPPTIAQHQFTLTFNLDTKLFSIKFVNHDGAVVTAKNIPFPYTPTRANKFTLNISSPEGGYIVDYVTVRQTPPPTYIGPIHPPF